MRPFLCVTLAALGLTAAPLWAQEVTLQARGGSFSLSGQLISHDGPYYRVMTHWGPVTLEAESVDCTGPACPHQRHITPEIRLTAEPWLVEQLLQPKLADYARAQGWQLIRDDQGYVFDLQGRSLLQLRLVDSDATASLTAQPRDQDPRIGHIPLTLITHSDRGTSPLSVQALKMGADRPLIWYSGPAGGVLDHSLTRLLHIPADRQHVYDPAARVTDDPWGIALVPNPPAGAQAVRLEQTCGLPLDLSDFAQSTGEHPLTQPIYWRQGPEPLPKAAADLLAHLIAAPQAPLPSRGLYEGDPKPLIALLDTNPELDLAARQKAIATLHSARRLAPTLRTRHEDELAPLIRHFETRDLRGQEILLVGFTSQSGLASANQKLSQEAADKVKDRLQQRLGSDAPSLIAIGLGEALPILCEDSPRARAINSRVEIWLRPVGHK